jgi:hypothetical protein
MKKFQKKLSPWMVEKPFELAQPFPGKTCVAYDIEVYPNFFMSMIIGPKNVPIVYKSDNLDQMISEVSNKKLIMVGFNNLGYDDYIMKYISMMKCGRLTIGLRNEFQSNDENFHMQLYNLTQSLFALPASGTKPQWYWDLWNYPVHWDFSMDVYCIPEKKMGLKERAVQRHAISIQDLPYPFDTKLTNVQKKEVIAYCEKDVRNTIIEWNDVQEHVRIRQKLHEMYPGTNVLSKHDAGICEEIITHEYLKRSGLTKKYIKDKIKKPGKKIDVKDAIPPWIEFENSILKNYLKQLSSLSGKFSTKKDLEILSEKLHIGDMIITTGGGGLHSKDKSRIIERDEDHLLFEIDIQSYYTNLIRLLTLYPEHLSPIFCEILKDTIELRVKKKKEGDKLTSDALKRITLSAFGKSKERYSIMFDELMQLQNTVGGQLTFLMLIEQLIKFKINIPSVNTDGILVHIPKKKRFIVDRICKKWENKTNLILEKTYYKKYIARDVNNYLAVKDDDSIKLKGIFRIEDKKKGIKKLKNKAEILQDALHTYFIDGTLPIDYIINCKDLRKFIFYFHVSGDWKMYHRRLDKNEKSIMVPIQNTSRWYLSNAAQMTEKGARLLPNVGDVIKKGPMTELERQTYCRTHNTTTHPDNWLKEIHVENGRNSVIINDLPNKFPTDLSYIEYSTLVAKRIKEIEDHV